MVKQPDLPLINRTQDFSELTVENILKPNTNLFYEETNTRTQNKIGRSNIKNFNSFKKQFNKDYERKNYSYIYDNDRITELKSNSNFKNISIFDYEFFTQAILAEITNPIIPQLMGNNNLTISAVDNLPMIHIFNNQTKQGYCFLNIQLKKPNEQCNNQVILKKYTCILEYTRNNTVYNYKIYYINHTNKQPRIGNMVRNTAKQIRNKISGAVSGATKAVSSIFSGN